MKRLSCLLLIALFLLSGCTLLPNTAAPTPSTTATTTATRSALATIPFYKWTQTEMITYLTEQNIITDSSLLSVSTEEELKGTGISGHFAYQTNDDAAILDVFFWDSNSTDDAVVKMWLDMKADRPLTLGDLTLTGDRRVGNFLFLYGTSEDPAFIAAVAAACDALSSQQ